MMASLIHTNREATNPTDTDDDATFRSSKKKVDSSSPEPSSSRRRSRRQLTLDTSFRPIKKQAVEEPSSDGEEDELFDAEEWEEGKGKGKGRKRSYDGPTATLVVAPVSLLHQWESELKKSAKKNSLRVFSECFLPHHLSLSLSRSFSENASSNSIADSTCVSSVSLCFRVTVYHGTAREEGLDFELEPTNPYKADVVLTSYGFVSSTLVPLPRASSIRSS